MADEDFDVVSSSGTTFPSSHLRFPERMGLRPMEEAASEVAAEAVVVAEGRDISLQSTKGDGGGVSK